MAPNTKARYWVFTWNNYSDASLEHLRSLTFVYLVFGKEVGENGTPHLQGTICFEKQHRFNAVKQMISNDIHLEMCKDLKSSVVYCKKDGDFEELGECPKMGKRSDLEDVKLAVKSNPNIKLSELRESYSEVYARYERWLQKYVQDNRPVPEIESHPLRPWQQDLNAKLNLAPDKRKVFFIVDTIGNSGKSWFCHYYASLHEFVDVLPPGRKENMVHVLSGQARVVFIDYPRSKTEQMQYDFFEELKNGYVFAQKYDSMIKKFPVPHVVVMMNEQPDMTKLSADRYEIINV